MIAVGMYSHCNYCHLTKIISMKYSYFDTFVVLFDSFIKDMITIKPDIHKTLSKETVDLFCYINQQKLISHGD